MILANFGLSPKRVWTKKYMDSIIRIGEVAIALNHGSTLTNPDVDIKALIDQLAIANK